ncbi:MAG: hypothetical protein ACM358_11355 [Gemmatimonadota bacterium]
MRLRILAGVAGLLPGLLGACYTYHAVPATPEPQTRVSIQLSDMGRVGTAQMIGPGTESVEGSIVAADDSAYRLAVSSVKPLRGPRVRWSGEQVDVRRSYVATVSEKRLSRGRTAVFSIAVAFVTLSTMVYFDILGFGSLNIPFIPGADGDADQ